jgi:DNA primase
MERTVDFQAIKAAVDMTQILAHYGLLDTMHPEGRRLRGCYPLHPDDTPSFHTTPNRHGFHCFGCQAHGNVMTFVRLMEGLSDDMDAARLIQEWFNLHPSPGLAPGGATGQEGPCVTPDTVDATTLSQDTLRNRPLGFRLEPLETTHPYLRARGLTQTTIRYFGLGYYGSPGIMAGRIVIPIHDADGRLVAYAGRWPGDTPPGGERKYKLPRGFHTSQELFNLHRLVPVTRSVFLVEGYWSVFVLHQLGFRQVVALMGSSLSDAQRALLCTRFQQVQVFLDGDAAGQAASARVLQALAPHVWVKMVPCPPGAQPDMLPLEVLRRLLR